MSIAVASPWFWAFLWWTKSKGSKAASLWSLAGAGTCISKFIRNGDGGSGEAWSNGGSGGGCWGGKRSKLGRWEDITVTARRVCSTHFHWRLGYVRVSVWSESVDVVQEVPGLNCLHAHLRLFRHHGWRVNAVCGIPHVTIVTGKSHQVSCNVVVW